MINRGSQLYRTYDAFVPPIVMAKAKQLRRDLSPDSECLPVRGQVVGGVFKWKYPWSKMKLGDYFIIPIRQSTEKAMRVRFRAAANRYDLELSVRRLMHHGEASLMVVVSMVEVRQWKLAALEAGAIDRVSDGRWVSTRRARMAEHAEA